MARQSRFIIRRIALCTGGALHKSAFSDETAPFYSAMKHFRFRSNMKHSAYAAYDLSSIALRATDDEKMKNESLSICNATLSALYYNLQSSPLWLDFFILILPSLVRSAVVYERIICKAIQLQKKICRNFKILSDITENLLYYR